MIKYKNFSSLKEQLLELHRGQGMEIWFRDNFKCPTEDEYRSLVNKSSFIVLYLIYIFVYKNIL